MTTTRKPRRVRRHGTYRNRPKKASPGQIYIRICAGPQRGKYVHQLVAEAKIGRALFTFESVDHLDGNTLNNAPENLDVVHCGDHSRREIARLDARVGAGEETSDVPF